MRRSVELPWNFPKELNEATGLDEQFAMLSHQAVDSIVSTGIPIYARGSTVTNAYLTPDQLRRFKGLSQHVLYGQRTVPASHFCVAQDPDSLMPLSGTQEFKVSAKEDKFRSSLKQMRANLKISPSNILLEQPSYLSPNASPALKRSYELLKPHNRIIWLEGEVPGKRGIHFGGLAVENDWVGAGSDHSTKLITKNCLFYMIGGKKDMRNPANMTNMEFWARVTKNKGVLTMTLSNFPDYAHFPFSAYERMQKRLKDPNDAQASWDVFQIALRDLRIANTLGKPFDQMSLSRLGLLSYPASRQFNKTPPSAKLLRDMEINLRMAKELDDKQTDRFIERVVLPIALRNTTWQQYLDKQSFIRLRYPAY